MSGLAEPLISASDAEAPKLDGDDLAATSAAFLHASRPCTRAGAQITAVEGASGPGPLCCGRGPAFFPTHAIVVAASKDGGGEERYMWDARAHRKMRYTAHVSGEEGAPRHPAGLFDRLRLLSYEPRNVTWWNCLVGEVANTLWVVNGIYAVWPELARDPVMGATNITYWTGVVGAGMFVVTGYLGWVEAINHTHSDVRLPAPGAGGGGPKESARVPRRTGWHYGRLHHPLGSALGEALKESRSMLATDVVVRGFPIVKDVATGRYVTPRLVDRLLEKFNGDDTTMEEAIRGRQLDLKIGRHTLRVLVDSYGDGRKSTGMATAAPGEGAAQGYVWWTRHPDLRHIGIFNALVYFVATAIFFVPAMAWYPMDALGDPTLASEIFWVYVLQIVPSCMFVYVGLAAMAEASGSWTRPAPGRIGWWISLFNFVGAIGFLSYAVLALPSVVGAPGCCDVLYKWGAAFATFWGSCAFWVAGLLQWAEFSSEHPIVALGSGGGGGETVVAGPLMKEAML